MDLRKARHTKAIPNYPSSYPTILLQRTLRQSLSRTPQGYGNAKGEQVSVRPWRCRRGKAACRRLG
ncbi:hypothetical protein [Dendronalium sp. ChiSLP03b]|uniref:hypothetical protein n=1 Tax=Dendronalium sp. ChiSLP03b TaxID=3075381 RepID=UPI002AD56F13|nr:hypothetical protein [Dendronalium sp. ChiSLP03b]MDZ8205587.1 hypothetical protein [Dendronalium sp. ChiSLP03b]